jgi:anti-sigma B factor antagonist
LNFSATSDRVDGACVVSVRGEVDLYNSPEVKRRLLDAISTGERYIVVDLTETTFVDSTTLATLTSARKRLSPHGKLVLVCTDRNIRKVLEVTGLDSLFAVYDSRADALAATNGHAVRR